MFKTESTTKRGHNRNCSSDNGGKYRLLLEQASDGIHTYDGAGNFLEVNSSLCEMLGYTREELLRLNVRDLLEAGELAAAPIRYDDLIAGKKVISERLLRRKDGTLIQVEISGNMIEAGLFQAIIRDITRRKFTEDALRESRQFVTATLDALNENIAVLDESGVIIAVNRAWREFAEANKGRAEKVGEGANYLDACRAATGVEVTDVAAFAAGISAVLKGEASEFSLEYSCNSPTERRWFVGRVTRFRPETPARVVVSHSNITERRLMEERLKLSEEWLRAIFEASRDGILVEDDERIAYVNKAYAHLLGYDDADELIGKHISAVLPDGESWMLEYGRMRMRGESAPSIYEFKGRRRDATLVDLEASVSTSVVVGKSYITTTVRDIAERKKAEQFLRQARDELERQVRERTAELTGLNEALKAEAAERKRAEEVRTQLLRRLVTAQEDERRRISRELHDQLGQHLAAMMLTLNALKATRHWDAPAEENFGQLAELGDRIEREVKTLAWELRPTALDDLGLKAAIQNYVETWAGRSRVVVDFQCAQLGERRLPPLVETTLYRIIQEALTNVIKHACAERVSLILGRRGRDVFCVVEDNGEGFEAEAVTGETAGGRKLGLLGMSERAALAGGTLNVESTRGVGTTLFVCIPLPDGEDGEIQIGEKDKSPVG